MTYSAPRGEKFRLEGGSVRAKEISRAVISYSYASPAYGDQQVLVPVVRVEELPDLIQEFDQGHELIAEGIVSAVNRGAYSAESKPPNKRMDPTERARRQNSNWYLPRARQVMRKPLCRQLPWLHTDDDAGLTKPRNLRDPAALEQCCAKERAHAAPADNGVVGFKVVRVVVYGEHSQLRITVVRIGLRGLRYERLPYEEARGRLLETSPIDEYVGRYGHTPFDLIEDPHGFGAPRRERDPAPAAAVQGRSPSPGRADVRSIGSSGSGRNSGNSKPGATLLPALMSAAMRIANSAMSLPVTAEGSASLACSRTQPKLRLFTDPMSAQ